MLRRIDRRLKIYFGDNRACLIRACRLYLFVATRSRRLPDGSKIVATITIRRCKKDLATVELHGSRLDHLRVVLTGRNYSVRRVSSRALPPYRDLLRKTLRATCLTSLVNVNYHTDRRRDGSDRSRRDCCSRFSATNRCVCANRSTPIGRSAVRLPITLRRGEIFAYSPSCFSFSFWAIPFEFREKRCT